MEKGFRIAVFISGRGSNFKSLAENQRHYKIAAVLSDNPEAPGLEWGQKFGIPCIALPLSLFGSKKAQRAELFRRVSELEVELICLAGFMQIIDPQIVRQYYGRLINIHPALLPKYPGLHTHRRALEDGVREHGCSVHFVDSGVDTGPIIAQGKCPCFPTDSEDELAARVLQIEHRIYPWVASAMARGLITLDGTKVHYAEGAIKEAREQGFILNCS